MRPTEAEGYRPVPELGPCACGSRFKQWQDDGSLTCSSCGQKWFVWEEVKNAKA